MFKYTSDITYNYIMCKKLINRNLSWIELGDQKGELSQSVTIAEPNRKKKNFFSGNWTQPMKSHGFFVYCSPPNFLFLSVKGLFPCLWGLARGSPRLQTLKCNSLLILNKLIFAGEISGSLFVSDQQLIF